MKKIWQKSLALLMAFALIGGVTEKSAYMLESDTEEIQTLSDNPDAYDLDWVVYSDDESKESKIAKQPEKTEPILWRLEKFIIKVAALLSIGAVGGVYLSNNYPWAKNFFEGIINVPSQMKQKFGEFMEKDNVVTRGLKKYVDVKILNYFGYKGLQNEN